jgi:Tfp pilus assembly protein PilX
MNNRGIALIASYMVIMVLTVLGSSFLMRSISEAKAAEYFSNSTRAFWVAESGLQIARIAFKDNNWANDNWLNAGMSAKRLTKSKGNAGHYVVEVNGIGTDNVVITSIGYSPDSSSPGFAERTISVSYSRSSSLFSYAAFGNTGVSLLGNARTDSYDSLIGAYGGVNIGSAGSVGTNGSSIGAITLTGSSRVNGDAETGPGGTVAQGWSCVVTGSITDTNNEPAAEVVVPGELSSLSSGSSINLAGSNSQVLDSGSYVMPSISVSGNAQLTLNGDVDIYLTGSSSLDVSGSGRLIINGTANIYIDGTANITGAGIVNSNQSPGNFILYGSPSSDSIQISGSGSMYAGIYAPNADVSITGNSGLYGAVVGDTVTLTGSSKIHYDEAFSDSGSGSGDYVSRNWQEI